MVVIFSPVLVSVTARALCKLYASVLDAFVFYKENRTEVGYLGKSTKAVILLLCSSWPENLLFLDSYCFQ